MAAASETPPWEPERPLRAASAWTDPPPVQALPERPGTPRDDAPRSEWKRPRSRIVGILRTVRPSARLAFAYGALAVAIVLVVGVGAPLQPRYGDLAPVGGLRFDDLRSTPVSRGWTTDLGAVLAPGAPTRCVSLATFPAAGGRVFVTTQSLATAGGFTYSGCTSVSSTLFGRRLALFDPVSGKIVWDRDLKSSSEAYAAVSAILPTRRDDRVVVQVDGPTRTRFVPLDVATGATGTSVTPPSTVDGFPSYNDRLLLLSTPSASEGSSSLVRLDDIRHTVWSGDIDPSAPPEFVGDTLVAMIDGSSMAIDGRTGQVTPFADGRVDLVTARTRGSVLVARLRSSGSRADPIGDTGGRLGAWNAAGERLWLSRTDVDSIRGSTRDCVLVTSPAVPTITCLDAATGSARWSADFASEPFVREVPGQTTDDVVSYGTRSSTLDSSRMNVVDGRSGRVRFSAQGPLASMTWASRTTGYSSAEASSAQFGGIVTSISALDLSTGRLLWNLEAPRSTNFDFWGGHLVSQRFGVVTGLHDAVADTKPVLG